MSPRSIYDGSDGAATQALYDRLTTFGAIGIIALNLFRASKCSGRAKEYSRRWKGPTYDRKNWSLENLHKALLEHAELLKLRWGWKEDPKQEFHKQVLYVDLPTGQASFHSANRFEKGIDYPGEWDGSGESANRIVRFTELVLEASTNVDVIAASIARVKAVAHEQCCFVVAVNQRSKPYPVNTPLAFLP